MSKVKIPHPLARQDTPLSHWERGGIFSISGVRVFLVFVIFNLSFVIFPQSALAQIKGLTVNGNDVSYDKDDHIIEASGSVEVVYKDVKVWGEHIIYDTQKDIVHADRGFVLFYQGLTIEGQTLDYNERTYAGTASKVAFTYRNIFLSGDEFRFDKEKFALKNSSFTTCDLPDPHYHVTAKDINVYPEIGWLVAYWGFFWLDRFPVVPVPTYIYDFSDESARNLPPFPEINTDPDYGWYVTERLAWYIRRELSGTYSMSYYTNKGLGFGGEASYLFNPQSRGNARLYWNMTDGIYGGVTHRFKYPQYEIDATLSSRERINYQKISYYPNLEFKVRRGAGLIKGIKHDADAAVGMVGEEGTGNYGEAKAAINFYGDLPENQYGLITPSLGLDVRTYSNGANWDVATGRIDLSKKISDLFSFGLGYSHYFSIFGQSPFLFEMYRWNPADRFTTQWLFWLGETKLEIATSYFTSNWWAEDLDYAAYFRLHCYDLMLKYRSLRNEFSMGFSLAGEK
ncbi:MAG: hypothetical protein QME05_02370 [Candidatus Margulisbacteria bacterium]|nr:hypothetical protein [Candidatus Margulisiibacteriota bacterium]